MFEEFLRRIGAQNEKKENWKTTDDPYSVAKFIREEADELVESIEEDAPAFGVGSELADVLYLSFLLCHQLGFDPADLLEFKLLRNDMKYPTDLNSEGEFELNQEQSKKIWSEMGGDEAFYHAYLNMFDTES